MRAKTVHFERGKDPKRSLDIGLQARMWNAMKDSTIFDLIWYLDDLFPEFEKYRDEEAQYDDAHYSDIPLKELEEAGITKELLEKIEDNTDNYGGWIHFDNENNVSIGGGD